MTLSTPIESVDGVMVKRDDLFRAPGGAIGGKARTCAAIMREGRERSDVVVTAGSRHSPQVNIVATIARAMGFAVVRVHTPTGTAGSEVAAAVAMGAERITHTPGYNTVLVRRASEDAVALGAVHVPFGMECDEAVEYTAREVVASADAIGAAGRVVIPVGSGMTLAGLLEGMGRAGLSTPVVGVVVGADPRRRLDRYVPMWRWCDVSLLGAGVPYATPVSGHLGDITLDPIYEAKCLPFLRANDLFWVVGIRGVDDGA